MERNEDFRTEIRDERFKELYEMISQGWGNISQDKIPSNWREIKLLDFRLTTQMVIDFGLCYMCKYNLRAENKTLCENCLARNVIYNRRSRQKERVDNQLQLEFYGSFERNNKTKTRTESN
jgi:hypothetical protein